MIGIDLSNDLDWVDVENQLPRAYSLDSIDFGFALGACRARVLGSRLASETARVVGTTLYAHFCYMYQISPAQAAQP